MPTYISENVWKLASKCFQNLPVLHTVDVGVQNNFHIGSVFDDVLALLNFLESWVTQDYRSISGGVYLKKVVAWR